MMMLKKTSIQDHYNSTIIYGTAILQYGLYCIRGGTECLTSVSYDYITVSAVAWMLGYKDVDVLLLIFGQLYYIHANWGW